MPRYDFKCLKCKLIVEVKRTMRDHNRAPKSCKFCRGRKHIRVWTPAALHVV